MGVDENEYATEVVPEHKTVSWVGVSFISAMVSFSLPTFLTGVVVFRASDNTTALWAVLWGCVVGATIAGLCGVIGVKTRLSSYMLTKIAFGSHGSALVNLAFGVSLLGWFGVNIDLFSETVIRLLNDTQEFSIAPWLIELFAGVIMTVTTIYGFKAINWLSMLLVPVMIVMTAILLTKTLGAHSIADILSMPQPDEPLSFGNALSSIVGGVIVGAVILPDITRFIKHWQGAVLLAILSYFFVSLLVMLIGGGAAEVANDSSLLNVMILMGLSWAAFVIIIAGSWLLNSLNLYSSYLSVTATIPWANSNTLVIVLGALGTAAAFLNILNNFIDFLIYLSVIFVPVAGIIAVDFIVVRRQNYHHQRFDGLIQKYVPLALLAWIVGATVALLGSIDVIHLSGVAVVDSIIASALIYFTLDKINSKLKT